MANGNQRPFLAAPSRNALVRGCEIRVFCFGGHMGNFDEDLPQLAIAFARLPTAALPRTLVVPRTHARPRGEMLGAGETAHIGPPGAMGGLFYGKEKPRHNPRDAQKP